MAKALRVVFIEDDRLVADSLLDWAKDHGLRAWVTDNAIDANQINADFYIFDMSAIGGTYQIHHCYSPLCTISTNHPGAIIGILTAWSKDCIQEVLDRVKKETGREPLYLQAGKNLWDKLESVIV